jgi:hypothetical protein
MNGARLCLAVSLLTASRAASACACCGSDDWWQSETLIPDSYLAGVVAQLRLEPGWIDYKGVESWEITGVDRADGQFIFRTEIGDFRFDPTAPPVHRAVDITFATKPDHELVDVADLYHEIIYSGVIHVPKAAAAKIEGHTFEANVVFQAVGNHCLDHGAFAKWLLSAEADRGWLLGSGKLGQVP